MKPPFALSILILAVGAAIGWSDHQRLLTVRMAHAQAVTEAAKRGISLDSSNEGAPVRVNKRKRESREAAAMLLAADYIGFAKEEESLRNRHAEPDEAFQERALDFNERMESLDPGQWRILINEVIACKELKNRTRQAFLYNAVTTFADKHPQAALTFFTESPDLFKGNSRGDNLVSTALRCWSQDDPLAAMEWVVQNGGNQSPLISDDTKHSMISAAARLDPALAFRLISMMEMKEVEPMHSAIKDVIGAATTPEKRTAALTGLRDYLATIKNEKYREDIAAISIMSLARYISLDGFDAAAQWVASAGLTHKELVSFASGLNSSIGFRPRFESTETGQWIEWIGKNLPAPQADQNIRNLVSQWTTNDYQAAGKWLGTAPEGHAKNTAIRSYAETVSKYEPLTAAQWAMTLPPGKDRDQTLKRIRDNWPENDPAAKEAFAKEHGLK